MQQDFSLKTCQNRHGFCLSLSLSARNYFVALFIAGLMCWAGDARGQAGELQFSSFDYDPVTGLTEVSVDWVGIDLSSATGVRIEMSLQISDGTVCVESVTTHPDFAAYATSSGGSYLVQRFESTPFPLNNMGGYQPLAQGLPSGIYLIRFDAQYDSFTTRIQKL